MTAVYSTDKPEGKPAHTGQQKDSHESVPDDVAVVHRSPTRRKGFAQVPHAVLTDSGLSDAAVRLYGVLLSYAMQADSFRLGQAKIGRDIGKDPRTVRRLLSELHNRGLVTPERLGQRLVNAYVIEDAYALYDGERPKPSARVRSQVGPDKNVPSAGNASRADKSVPSADRTKMPGRGGQKRPVTGDKNALILKTEENTEEKQQQTSALTDPPQGAEPAIVVGDFDLSETKVESNVHDVAPDVVTDAAPSPAELLVRELVSEGMGEGQAQRAVSRDHAAAVHQLENLRHALPTEALTPPSRGAWLHVAIRDGYGPTKGYAKFLEGQRDREKRREAKERRDAAQRAKNEAERVLFEELDLTPEELASLRQKARNCVSPVFRDKGRFFTEKLVEGHYRKLLRGEELEEYGHWPEAGADGVDHGEPVDARPAG